MSRFLSSHASTMEPYVPGEQPRDKLYIKLNTNENPYPPSPKARAAVTGYNAARLNLYPDPTSSEFRAEIAKAYNLAPEQVFAGGGSDEVLAYAFMAFFDRGDKVYFPDITYAFYRVYAGLFGLNAVEIPLMPDFTLCPEDYFSLDGNIFLANPNAPTGICLEVSDIERILINNPDRLLVVDEAYIDFSGGKSCLELINRYDNLLVIQTFSKSYGLAGMRLGAGFGNPKLIEGLERIKYSFNPYNLDRVSLAVGIAAVRDVAYKNKTAAKIIATRERVRKKLLGMGFTVLPSDANFLFIKSPNTKGAELYKTLKQNGILVRYFGEPRVSDFIRVTVGTDSEMEKFLEKVAEIS